MLSTNAQVEIPLFGVEHISSARRATTSCTCEQRSPRSQRRRECSSPLYSPSIKRLGLTTSSSARSDKFGVELAMHMHALIVHHVVDDASFTWRASLIPADTQPVNTRLRLKQLIISKAINEISRIWCEVCRPAVAAP